MDKLLIQNARVYQNGQFVRADVLCGDALIAKIGENMSIRRIEKASGDVLASYVHGGGRIGVLVNMDVEGIDPEKVTEMGKDLCMQVAAMNPSFCDKADVDQATLDKEKEIQLALMDNDPKMASKPLQVKEKIVLGKMSKYYEENCLMQMEFVKEKGVSVEQHVAAVAKELGGKIAVKSFVRFERGEGIEKKQEDFAAEVAAQMNMGK